MKHDISNDWKVCTPQLLKEILCNKGADALGIPLRIFAQLLAQAAERSAEINDPILISIMARLALYEFSDPYSEEYDEEATKMVIQNGSLNHKNLQP
jgi:hypothetical protein